MGNGDGTFQPAKTFDSGNYYANAVAVADVNDDGKLDVLVAHRYWYGLSVLLGNGDGSGRCKRRLCARPAYDVPLLPQLWDGGEVLWGG